MAGVPANPSRARKANCVARQRATPRDKISATARRRSFGDIVDRSISFSKIAAPRRRAGFQFGKRNRHPHRNHITRLALSLRIPPTEWHRFQTAGGIWGLYEFVEAVNNPDDPEHEDKLEWYGAFDPTEFDKDEATAAMQ